MNLTKHKTIGRMIGRNIFALFLLTVLSGAASLFGQDGSPLRNDETEDDVIELDPFVVEDTYLSGYVSNSARSGFKTRQRMIDIPQAIQVIPRDLIEDLAQFNGTADTLQYAVSGVVPFVNGEFQIQRGTRALFQALYDGMPEVAQKLDHASIDSIEVIKGPASVLYGNLGSFNGLILKNSKKPLDEAFGRVKVMGSSEDGLRFEADFTGPIGSITEDVQAFYRVVATTGDYGTFADVGGQNSTLFAPSLRLDLGEKTTLTLQADIVSFDDDNTITWNFYDEGGKNVYTAAGANHPYNADWMTYTSDRDLYKLNLQHAFTRALQMDVNLYYNKRDVFQEELRPTGPANFETFEMGSYYLGNYVSEIDRGLHIDFVYEYQIGSMKAQTNFGGRISRREIDETVTFSRNTSFDDDDDETIFPVTDIRTNERLFIPYPAETLLRSRRTTPISQRFSDVYHGYILQTIEPIEDRLILVAGLGYEDVRSGSNKRSPYGTSGPDVEITDSTHSKAKANPYRLGVVFKVTDEISLFANNSTRYEPQNGFDIDGNPFPDVTGEVKEIGLKTALYEGKISATITYFDMDITNQTIVVTKDDGEGGVISGFKAQGVTSNKGLEVDLGLRLLPNWQVILAGYFGENLGNNGEQLGNSIKQHMAITTKYDFTEGALEGLSAGLSAVKTGARKGSIRSVERLNAFFGYKINDNWKVNLNIDNLLDEESAINGWASWILRVGEPRTYKLSAAYTF